MGLGAMGTRLARRYQYVGVEPDARSFRIARERIEGLTTGKVYPMTIAALPEPKSFDLVCAFEVLEHIEDDASALSKWRSVLRPRGWLLLSVPAHQRRFGPSDERVGHYRRYERTSLTRLLGQAGYTDIAISTYGFPLGFALDFVRNRLAGMRPHRGTMADRTAESGRTLQPPGWLGSVVWVATLPFRALQIPFEKTDIGTGFVVSARRREDVDLPARADTHS